MLVVVDHLLAHDPRHRIDFKQYLLEPEFVRLVNNDKQHFIVRMRPLQVTFQGLRVEDFVELEVVGVVDFFWHGGGRFFAQKYF